MEGLVAEEPLRSGVMLLSATSLSYGPPHPETAPVRVQVGRSLLLLRPKVVHHVISRIPCASERTPLVSVSYMLNVFLCCPKNLKIE